MGISVGGQWIVRWTCVVRQIGGTINDPKSDHSGGNVLCHSASFGQLVVARHKEVNRQTGDRWEKLLSWPAGGLKFLCELQPKSYS